MKNYIKRITAFILTLAFAFSYATYAYASEMTPRISFSASMQIVSRPSVDSSSESSSFLGHSFLIIKNVGVSTIKIGHMSVAVGDSITVGTFNTRENHTGIWYNLEGYQGSKGTSYGLTCGLTGAEVATVTDTINAHNEWSVTKNCSYFAKTVWNSVSSVKLSGNDPLALANSIKKINGYVTNPSIPHKEKSQVAIHTSTGVKYPYKGKSLAPDVYSFSSIDKENEQEQIVTI